MVLLMALKTIKIGRICSCLSEITSDFNALMSLSTNALMCSGWFAVEIVGV